MPSYNVQRPTASGGSRRNSSPDSLIFTPESNLSLFSSASVSVDRCSSTSDAHDRDSLVSAPSLERDQRVSSSCKDVDPGDKRGTGWKQSRSSRKANKVKAAWKEEFEVNNKEDENQNLDSARSSFSVALRECQERKSRSEAIAKKLDYERNVSLDISNVTSTSPRVVNVKRTSVSTNKSSVFPSPGTPTYMQKGWSSERVALRSNGGRSPPNAGFLPLYSGRTVPSKWEDAERWIVSPLAREGAPRTSFAASHERRPKSKSGPLGPPGVAYYSLYSPAVPMVHGGNMGNLTSTSPFSAGVLQENGCSRGSVAPAFPQRIDPCMGRSVSIHGCSETLPSLLSSQDDIHDNTKDAAATDARAVSRRDMATQMSPEGSIRLSPERHYSYSPSSPSAVPIGELLNAHSNRAEANDLQVDEKVTVTRWSKRHRALYHGDSSQMRDHLHGKARDPQGLTWAKTEEARIMSWENLQKAKAEAKIRKLEMKLEKKRSSSMEKIMRKVKSAEKRAEEMRRSVLDNQVPSASRRKAISFRRSGKAKIASLSGCFTCHVC
ncbi:hypothetical protein AALP_AA4G086500 [Arabis alpina]|uniref:Remorin C-terminal domain-containing protein n=1 Tax=Arabis alpina TaxID=50452 RepID=A0A087H213_ARAAL|nr:hypothetical protein AALP_AA4G086500 [Arabis alpina]